MPMGWKSSLLDFLRHIAADTPALDVMIEAKRKDEALVQLMQKLAFTRMRVLSG